MAEQPIELYLLLVLGLERLLGRRCIPVYPIIKTVDLTRGFAILGHQFSHKMDGRFGMLH